MRILKVVDGQNQQVYSRYTYKLRSDLYIKSLNCIRVDLDFEPISLTFFLGRHIHLHKLQI